MKPEEAITEWIDRYLEGQLSSQEQDEFKRRLQQEEDFRLEVEAQQAVRKTLQQVGEAANLKAAFKRFHACMRADRPKLLLLREDPAVIGERVMNDSEEIITSEAQYQLFVKQLKDQLNPSLGTILTAELAAKSITDLSIETDLPVDVLEALKSDMLFPTNVPVMLMKRLLNALGIKYQRAEKAILKTVEAMVRQPANSIAPGVLQPSYRRAAPLTGEIFKGSPTPGSLNHEVFETEGALRRYLKKLSEEMLDS